jgi:hypothetical protein
LYTTSDEYYDEEDDCWYPVPEATLTPTEYYEWKIDRVNTWGNKDEQAMYREVKQVCSALEGWVMWNASATPPAQLHYSQLQTLSHLDELIEAIDEKRPMKTKVIEENQTGRLLTSIQVH